MTKSLCTLLILPILLFFTACAPVNQTASKSWTNNSLAKKTYNAVDMVLKQTNIPTGTPVLVGTLSDINALETSTSFGRVVSEQLSTRLAQRELNVTELKLRNNLNIKRGLYKATESGEFLLSRDVAAIAREQNAVAVMTGTYAVANDFIMINLKMIDVTSGKIIGATDYSVRNDQNMQDLLNSDGQGFKFYGSSIAY